MHYWYLQNQDDIPDEAHIFIAAVVILSFLSIGIYALVDWLKNRKK